MGDCRWWNVEGGGYVPEGERCGTCARCVEDAAEAARARQLETMMVDCGHRETMLAARQRAGRTLCVACATFATTELLDTLAEKLTVEMHHYIVQNEVSRTGAIIVNSRVIVSVNDETGAVEIHALALCQGPVVSIDASLPRGYAIRTAVEAVQNVVAVV